MHFYDSLLLLVMVDKGQFNALKPLAQETSALNRGIRENNSSQKYLL